MMTMYDVYDGRGMHWPVFDAERAERLSRTGYRVTAITGV